MKVQWYGQPAFHLTAPEASVTLDPFVDLSGRMADRGMQWDYPAIAGPEPMLLLVTHEHIDHNGVDAVGGDPTILRSTAGRLESPIGEVIAIASEHDENAGAERGPNTIFVFELDGVRVAHFGDFGQCVLREEQAELLDDLDLISIPVGVAPPSAPSRPPPPPACARAGSYPCTTAPRGSPSSRPLTPSSSAQAGVRRAHARASL